MGRLKKPPALSSAALHHLLWDYGIVFTLQQDTAVAPSGGRSYYSRTSLEADLFGGGEPSTVYTWLDPQRTCCDFAYAFPWSPAGLVHALKGDIVFAARLWEVPAPGRSGRHHHLSRVGVVIVF